MSEERERKTEKEEKDREKEHMQGPRTGSLSFKPSAIGKY